MVQLFKRGRYGLRVTYPVMALTVASAALLGALVSGHFYPFGWMWVGAWIFVTVALYTVISILTLVVWLWIHLESFRLLSETRKK